MLKLKLNVLQKFMLLFCTCTVLINCTTDDRKIDTDLISGEKPNFEMRSSGSDIISDILNIDKNDQIAVDFISELTSKLIDISNLDLDNIIQILFHDFETALISVGFNDSSDKIIAYHYGDQYALMKSKNTLNEYEITTIDGLDFIELEYFPEQRNAEITEFHNNQIIVDYSDYIHSRYSESENDDEDEVCCRKRDYIGCVQCSTFDNGLLNIIIGALVPELAVAILVSCIGAGPNAWC